MLLNSTVIKNSSVCYYSILKKYVNEYYIFHSSLNYTIEKNTHIWQTVSITYDVKHIIYLNFFDKLFPKNQLCGLMGNINGGCWVV